MPKQLNEIFKLLQRIDKSYYDYALLNESLLLEAASLSDVYKNYYSNIPEEEFRQIVSADPTSGEDKMGKYSKWLLALYTSENLKLEDLYKATQYLTTFHKYKQKLDKKDIGQYKSLPELYQAIQPYEDNTQAASHKEEIRQIKKNAEKVYEDEEWLVIVPKTKEAAIEYGKGTQWCTAATTSDNMFDSYNSEGPLYININKKSGEKFQFHFESYQFMDERDEPCGAILKREDKLFQFYKQKCEQKGNLYGLVALIYDNWKDIYDNDNSNSVHYVGVWSSEENDCWNIVNLETLEEISDVWFDDIAGECWSENGTIAVDYSYWDRNGKFREYSNLINTKGQFVFDKRFYFIEKVGVENRHFVARNIKDEKYVLIDDTGNQILDCSFEMKPSLEIIGPTNQPDKRAYIIRSGRMCNILDGYLKPMFDEWFTHAKKFKEDFKVYIVKEGKYALLDPFTREMSNWYDKMGTDLIPALSFKNEEEEIYGMLLITQVKLNGKYNYLTSKGIELFDEWFDKLDYIQPFSRFLGVKDGVGNVYMIINFKPTITKKIPKELQSNG